MSKIRVNRFENTSGVGYGTVLQTVNYSTGEMATGTTTIPYDDTIPQNNEGTEFMTLAITPKSATNKLKITVSAWVAVSATTTDIIAALFKDSDADALAAVSHLSASTNMRTPITFVHYMTAGSTAQMTFKVRIGGSSASTITFNGSGGARKFGGVAASSITIEEIQV